MNTAHIRLNLNKGIQPAGDEITIAQGDKHGLTITATIYDGTEKATLTGYTAHVVAQLPDRTHYYRETATINGSDVTAVIDETKIGTIPGHTDNAYFTLEATDGTIYSTARFGIDILNDALSDTTAADTYDATLYPAGTVIAGTPTLDTSGLGGTWSSIGTITIGTTEVTFYQRTA